MEKVIDKELRIKTLDLSDIDSIDLLLKECDDYYLLHNGIPHTRKDIEEILTSLPPNKESQDKFVLGIFYKDELNQLFSTVELSSYPISIKNWNQCSWQFPNEV